eukprot:TRINITY_DN27323_c0_g1_i1.p1 TRINITY_DN27323_c0_g1~~TRINITY_DN27323_c0_g1_i1.p1  ORF type:complete len:1121 (+),score=220.77 TRINITY_DN27323_c0_g1_i1:106-3468(+)
MAEAASCPVHRGALGASEGGSGEYPWNRNTVGSASAAHPWLDSPQDEGDIGAGTRASPVTPGYDAAVWKVSGLKGPGASFAKGQGTPVVGKVHRGSAAASPPSHTAKGQKTPRTPLSTQNASIKGGAFRAPPPEQEVKTLVGQRVQRDGAAAAQKLKQPKAASPGGTRGKKEKARGKRAAGGSSVHAHDLCVEKKSHAKHPYGLKGNQRGFGGVYKNRKTKIILVPGETILKTVNCSMLQPSQGHMVAVRFIVTNYRVGLKLLETPVPRAITIPLAHIEKIGSRSIKHGGDLLSRSRSPSPGPALYNAEGRSHSPGSRGHGSPYPSRRAHDRDVVIDMGNIAGSAGNVGRFAPTVAPASKYLAPGHGGGSAAGSSVQGDDDRSSRAASPKRDMRGDCDDGWREGKRSNREGLLCIQTKGVQLYSVHMRAEDSVIVQQLLHNLTVSRPGAKPFCALSKDAAVRSATAGDRDALDPSPSAQDVVAAEFQRFGSRLPPPLAGQWRLTTANAGYKLVGSYPEVNIVPANAVDALLNQVSEFRTKNRFPVVTWIHPDNGATISRSSQPKVGFGGKRSNHDEMYVSMLQRPKVDLNASGAAVRSEGEDESGSQEGSDSASQGQPAASVNGKRDKPKELVILDCRPFANAVANRSRMGGYEDEKYYHGCAYDNADLGNIHEVTGSLKALRRLLEAPLSYSSGGWSAAFLSTGWIRHVEKIIVAALRVVAWLDQGQSVLVHCSDGWDRTTQVVSLAKLLLDPYYRTIDGFQTLIQFDWLGVGHKFADRHYNAESNASKSECSPIFLQWCDCVWQVWRQYPSLFEFSDQFLIYILHHATSGRFATFLHNNVKEREAMGNIGISFWAHLNSPEQRYHRPEFLNVLYTPNTTVIRPSNWPRQLLFWEEVHAQLDFEWSDLWAEPLSDRMMAIGREIEMHRVKGPKLEEALRKRMNHLSSYATMKHLASLVDTKQGVVDSMRQLLEDEVLTRVFERIDIIESHSIQQLLEDAVLTRVFGIIDVIEAQRNHDAGHTVLPSEKKLGAVARWVPDNMAPICAACLVPFKWWRRRHHCRFCGHVYCTVHSSQRRALPDKPQAGQVRVCDDCASLLDRAARSPRHVDNVPSTAPDAH